MLIGIDQLIHQGQLLRQADAAQIKASDHLLAGSLAEGTIGGWLCQYSSNAISHCLKIKEINQ
jgi:hypothetical protein